MSLERLMEFANKDFSKDAEFVYETIKNLNLEKDSKILDIGTGFGIMAIILALNGFEVLTGEPEVDSRRDHMNHQGEHHGSFGYNWRDLVKKVGVEQRIKYQHFDAQELPFPNERFDGIFLYDTLQHVQNKKVVLMECIRVLKPKGIMGVIEWTKKQIKEDYKKYGFKLDFIDPQDIINQKYASINVITGQYVNIYLIRKK